MDLDVPFTFGLSVAKRNKVALLRSATRLDWPAIGREVGWEGETLRRYYEREAAPVATLNPYSDANFLAQFIAAAG